MLKVVIDTNIIISATLSPTGNPAKIIDMVFEDKLQIFYSLKILSEYKEMLAHPRLKIVTQTQIDILSAISEVGTLIEPPIRRYTYTIESESAKAVIPSRKNRKTERDYDKEVYKNRNQIERFFNRIKQCRRIATRYDKLVSSFLSFIQLAATLIVLPKFPLIV